MTKIPGLKCSNFSSLGPLEVVVPALYRMSGIAVWTSYDPRTYILVDIQFRLLDPLFFPLEWRLTLYGRSLLNIACTDIHLIMKHGDNSHTFKRIRVILYVR